MRRFVLVLSLLSLPLHADLLPFVPDSVLERFAEELSGETAKRNLEGISRYHRTRGSRQYRAAGELVLAELKRYGFTDARIETFPTDGKIFYGTQRSRPAWNAEMAELWDVKPDGSRVRLASWDAAPITLAQDSASADVTTELIDAGDGTKDSDYAEKDVNGKIVLVSAQAGAAAKLAVEKYGAVGLVSYAPNQRTAWWREDENLIRWGHLETFAVKPTFAFMVSLRQARALQERLRAGQKVTLHAVVKAGHEPGGYDLVMATIPGSDAGVRNEEIVFSCHLDHPRPGANDNASGCATILEVARTTRKLIDEGRIAAPRRTMRFVWPPEVEGTLAFLNGRPEVAARIKAAIHLDMVGGGEATKAIFHVTRGPASQPSFINDIAEEIGALVNGQSRAFASTGSARLPLVATEGGKEALQAELVPMTLGSDHQVYSDSSWGIPSIYLNDWPDRYIHTNFDVAANIDPTKLKRAGFIAGVSGYVLANAADKDSAAFFDAIRARTLRRIGSMLESRRNLAAGEATNRTRFQMAYERALFDSMRRFLTVPAAVAAEAAVFYDTLERLAPFPTGAAKKSGMVYRRNPNLKGPMEAFGYNYFTDKYGEEKAATIKLGGEHRYEALNLVDGKRTTTEIRDALSAIYRPVPAADVEQYLEALASIGVIEAVSR